MARGKHASRAEAARARESAETRLEEAERAVGRLTREVADLQEQLEAERRESTERLRAYVALMEEGASPEVLNLRAQLQEMAVSLKNAQRDVGLKVAALFRSRRDFKATVDLQNALAKTLQVSLAELCMNKGEWDTASRMARRAR